MNIEDMNTEHIDNLINYLEYRVKSNPLSFDMAHFFLVVDCGTTACMAGHCAIMRADPKELLNPEKFKESHYFFKEAQEYLGLDWTTADRLFMGNGVACRATLDEAIDTLKILRETGVVDWSATRERYNSENF